MVWEGRLGPCDEDDGLILCLGKRWEEKKERKKMKGRNERET